MSGIEINHQLRTLRLADNLFQPLHPRTRSEFEAGAGDELGTPGAPGKLASVHSSAALACNVFDFWRDKDTAPLMAALGLQSSHEMVSFEATHPTGLRGTPPHLDVELSGYGLVPVAIESKFTEPYGTVHDQFRPAYFERPGIWEGLDQTRSVAALMAAGGIVFVHFHAAQLIKHILGLSRSYGTSGFILMYLWFGVDGLEGELHQAEVSHFAEIIGDEVSFAAMTYQDLLTRFEADEPSRAWHRYVTDRYVNPPDSISQ